MESQQGEQKTREAGSRGDHSLGMDSWRRQPSREEIKRASSNSSTTPAASRTGEMSETKTRAIMEKEIYGTERRERVHGDFGSRSLADGITDANGRSGDHQLFSDGEVAEHSPATMPVMSEHHARDHGKVAPDFSEAPLQDGSDRVESPAFARPIGETRRARPHCSRFGAE